MLRLTSVVSPEVRLMRTARFCSGCGEELKAKRASLRPFRVFCMHCAPSWSRARRLRIAAFAMIVAGAFLLGRYSSPPQPFYFIGTPAGSHSGSIQSSTGQDGVARSGEKSSTTQIQQQPSASTNAVEVLCGARTKSGRPCRRKVRGGGHCYQHRDKSEQKAAAGKQ